MTKCKIIKKCPCCKKKMVALVNGISADYQERQMCINDKCKFYGIERYCWGTSFK